MKAQVTFIFGGVVYNSSLVRQTIDIQMIILLKCVEKRETYNDPSLASIESGMLNALLKIRVMEWPSDG